MNRVEQGMAVFGIRGRRVGEVTVRRENCFEVSRHATDGGPICLTAESLFTVEQRDGITLVCSNDDIERYRCMDHSPQLPRAGNRA